VSGPRLVLLPGLDGTGALFAPFLRAWNESPPPLVIGYPRDRFLDYAQAARHVLGHLPSSGKFTIVAESFSGPVVMALAARIPDRIAALVLCATFASPPRKGVLRQFLRIAAPLVFLAPSPALLVREVLLNGCDERDLLDLVCANKRDVSPGVMTRRFCAVLSCDAREDLKRIQCPLLYLQAAHDRLVPASAADEILSIRPSAQLARMASPHFVLQAAPEESARTIRRFVSELPRE